MTSNRKPREMKEPLVSVIVPCYNSERTIRQCLGSIVNQRTAVPFDVTVVDSSTDRTPQIVQEEFPSVRLIHLDRRTFAGPARNVGIKETRGRFCLMIDSDCIARPDLVERAMARHGEAEYAAVGGSLRSGTHGSLSGLVGYLAEFKEFMPTTPARIEKGIPTANLCYRREVLERFGGFDDDMQFAEDILLNWKIHSAGLPIFFDPSIEVTHLNRTGWRSVLGYQVGLGRLSAKARRRGGLPGRFLLDYPALILLMPIVRTINAAKWFAKHDLRMLFKFLFVWPFYLLAMGYWSYGFFKGATRKE
jgi:glycosyltransferase involved in cell wall biosynthesis